MNDIGIHRIWRKSCSVSGRVPSSVPQDLALSCNEKEATAGIQALRTGRRAREAMDRDHSRWSISKLEDTAGQGRSSSSARSCTTTKREEALSCPSLALPRSRIALRWLRCWLGS